MRALLALVIGMGVLIVAGVAVVGVTIMHRMSSGAGPAHTVVLDEPEGTHIVSVSPDGDRLAVLLSGGGSDRVVLVAPSGAITGRVALRR